MNYLVNLEKCVTGFCIDDQFVDCISNESVYKIDKHTKEIIYSKKLFKKEGFSRNLVSNNKLLFIRDFFQKHQQNNIIKPKTIFNKLMYII